MRTRDAFSAYHPLVNFLYFALVVVSSMFFMHPIALCISLISSLGYAFYLKGGKMLRFSLCGLLPMLLLAAVLNPAFNHDGITILTYLPSGNPLTLESVIYGLAAAVMLVAVICWFVCYTAVMSSDKFVYLFGRIIPALSLVLAMSLRFVPRFKDQLQVITEAQSAIGKDVSTGGVLKRLRTAIGIVSIMISWALENAIETADSMKSRGYGLPGRTAFAIYRIVRRDVYMLIWLLVLAAVLICGWALGICSWQYFPYMQTLTLSPFAVLVWLSYFALTLTPLWVDWKEARQWRYSQSRI